MAKNLLDLQPERILIRAANWIGDAVMTLPAVRTVRENFPQARIDLLAQPWVADVFSASPHLDGIVLYDKKGAHAGLSGMVRLARDLAGARYDLAILLQNAFEAAFIARLARIPAIAGYRRDARSLLLTHGVSCTRQRKQVHQVAYYHLLLDDLGLRLGPERLDLPLSPEQRDWARDFHAKHGAHRPVIGVNPGAAYGPAKRWPAERYGEVVAKALRKHPEAVVYVFGTTDDRNAATEIRNAASGHIIDLTGRTTLSQAIALIALCDVFITNDSGLMHVAAALDRPLVAVFGSTNPVTTGPFSDKARVVRKAMECSPCYRTNCRRGFECMRAISPDEVAREVLAILDEKASRDRQEFVAS